ncbi:hypothetical protein LTS18_006864 [Coniosporium uncinatum]|uniref:Uncharacterized protein n=1 Tax=Coniosporium uncinatum TaxID=93489 RepID=A0ACC3DPZ7_9PEZI|nr:hypothetical protein LTS18_006864 [Coniosporium uncinatum]
MVSSRTKTIKGSCLCAAIRFTITLPIDWQPESTGTCQCTQCRRFTGALVPQNIVIPTEYVEPSFDSQPSYKTYQSGPKSYRGFCSTCGSSLTFRDTKGQLWIHLGSFDEENLVGRKVGEVYETKWGKIREWDASGSFGKELAKAKDHVWVENAVPRVTDVMAGKKYMNGREGVEGFEGGLMEPWKEVKQ